MTPTGFKLVLTASAQGADVIKVEPGRATRQAKGLADDLLIRSQLFAKPAGYEHD